MKNYIAFFMILIFVGSLSFAQETVPGPSAGSKGVLFSFSGHLVRVFTHGGRGGYGIYRDYLVCRVRDVTRG